jgi:hypothetical protein
MVYSTNMHSASRLLPSSSLLEVELHDGEAKQEGEEHGKCHDNGRHPSQPAVLEVEVVLDKHTHGCAVVHRCHHVPKLRHHETVQRPCDRTYVAVPPPPDRHFLNVASGQKRNE